MLIILIKWDLLYHVWIFISTLCDFNITTEYGMIGSPNQSRQLWQPEGVIMCFGGCISSSVV